MDKTTVAAIATAAATIITALLASLAGLGEHAPSTVLALIVIGIVLFFYIAREKQIEQEHAACRECKNDHASDYRDMVTKLMALADATNDGMNAVNATIATMSRNAQVSEKLDAMTVKLNAQEVRTRVNAKRGSGRSGAETR